MSNALRFILFGITWLLSELACAHAVGTSYLHLSEISANGKIALRADVALRDLETAIGVDHNGDAKITWAELSTAQDRVWNLITENVRIVRGQEQCRAIPGELLVENQGLDVYAVIAAQFECGGHGDIVLSSQLLFDVDAGHRTVVRYGAKTQESTILSAHSRTRALAERHNPTRTFAQFAASGMHHIWIGWDHLAFLLVLLLPAVLNPGRRESQGGSNGRWSGVRRIIALVTAFTLAHSVTLAATVLGYVSLPEKFVEIAIAASVIVAALSNLHSRSRHSGVVTAFGFGLLHGFGFANVLDPLQLSTSARGFALVGFNLGVEVGQLIVVAAVVPLLYLLARRGNSHRVVFAGSIAVAALGFWWLAERSIFLLG